VRGAPALGAAAAFGVYLGIKDYKGDTWGGFSRKLDSAAKHIASSRPTARNLFMGVERVCASAVRNRNRPVPEIKKCILEEAREIMREDNVSCRRIGMYGSRLLKGGSTVLTICNAGILATIDYGTALGVVYSACAQGKNIKYFPARRARFSREPPYLLGAFHKGVDVTMIADNTAASLMAAGKVDAVITGADRIAANGDAANKIGTLNLAILCKYHKVPFYIAAPKSTFDLKAGGGSDIKIEMRASAEVSGILDRRKTAPRACKAFNPAFDVTGHGLINAIITDYGIIRPP